MSLNTIIFVVVFQITEDLNADPEADSDHFMIVIIESLSLLGKIPEALEVHCVAPENICTPPLLKSFAFATPLPLRISIDPLGEE